MCSIAIYRLVYSCSCSWWWIIRIRQQAEIVTANLQNIDSSVNLAEACTSHFAAGDMTYMTHSANNPSCGYTNADRPSASWEDSKASAEFKVQFRHLRIVLARIDAVYSHASTATHSSRFSLQSDVVWEIAHVSLLSESRVFEKSLQVGSYLW